MSSYHQMGHKSDNLLACRELQSYRGAILSPVNYTLEETIQSVVNYRKLGQKDIIFDSQLYFPNAERQKLRNWPYFPDAFQSLDITSDIWWSGICTNLFDTSRNINANAICSPATIPRSYTDEYFHHTVQGGKILYDICAGSNIEAIQTIVLDTTSLSNIDKVQTILSIVTRTPCQRIYLIMNYDLEPRREISDTEFLRNAMLFINILEKIGMQVIVGYCSTDMILWKASGATSCATGKHWMLRRFTPSRWQPDEGGRGQIAYWTEESLMGFIREGDIARIQALNHSIVENTVQNNPFSQDILSSINRNQPWVGISWKQYLYWFMNLENTLRNYQQVDSMLKSSESLWNYLEDKGILMEERRNNGEWIRFWRIALKEFASLKDTL